jgi:hypothetical protein
MNSGSLLIFLGLNKSKNELLIRAQCRARSGLGYSPRGVAACHARPAKRLAGPWPGGPIRRRSSNGAACAGRAHGAVIACSLLTQRHGGALTDGSVAASWRQGAAGELTGATGRASGKAIGGGAHQRGDAA